MAAPAFWPRLRRDPRRQVVLAYILWLVLAAVVWNVIFDRVLVLAGRRYVYAAAVAFAAGQPPVSVAPWMAAARADGARLATTAALPLALIGIVAVRIASPRQR